MLETYPERGNLTVILLPLAKEVLSSYGNIPIKVAQLTKECEVYKEKFGFLAFDLTLLKDDDLWYLRQLELKD